MPTPTSGLHHVTAIATDPQRNVDFYLTVLGLRLVKRTVNFDVPDTYHLYYGDEAGRPGSLLTFFPWPDTAPGRHGTGQATTTSFSVPPESFGWWKHHLEDLGTDVANATDRDDESAISFFDPDGLHIELVAHAGADPRPPATGGPIPEEHAVRGLHSVTMTVSDHTKTADLFGDELGLRLGVDNGQRLRFVAGDGGPGDIVDVVAKPQADQGIVAAGTVHHMAWRLGDSRAQAPWREQLVEHGYHVTPIIDRHYFQSIYFREPGGVLQELATEEPGFDVDEPLLELGRALKLPPWLEPNRDEIERALPPINLPRQQ